MPVSMKFIRKLDDEYQKLVSRSNEAAPRNGSIPIGGGDWMDNFFKSEAIRGVIGALRRGNYVGARAEGKELAELAIQIWNGRREWQVHRSKHWIDDFISDIWNKCRCL